MRKTVTPFTLELFALACLTYLWALALYIVAFWFLPGTLARHWWPLWIALGLFLAYETLHHKDA